MAGYIGHTNAGHIPDEPYNDPYKALEAALAIYHMIPDGPRCCNQLSIVRVAGDLESQFKVTGSTEQRISNMKNLINAAFGESVNY